ncbi:hypothetical protein [Pantoea agglomerans]|uniref:hypothetical protein n=1 Tax=Enterobacter agglomerans TaxID=549 RepID=UPI0010C11632|nr:hypothetical protein [Pantoea agglomerans]MBD8145133.1 hypothetical protein [Pantoea agglomerans]MBD8223440.1 hypothetical protein [Pantoea agglomerans]TKK17230.1 hypothetical protein PagCFBP13516_16545 [Pantoea agglomerans]TKK27890.1 hypothetical protein PagCFBP13532_20480 [Pantoea agglomerans]WVL80712.1 hypothetical protein IFT78_003085 [Pantoea agglomerans]
MPVWRKQDQKKLIPEARYIHTSRALITLFLVLTFVMVCIAMIIEHRDSVSNALDTALCLAKEAIHKSADKLKRLLRLVSHFILTHVVN